MGTDYQAFVLYGMKLEEPTKEEMLYIIEKESPFVPNFYKGYDEVQKDYISGSDYLFQKWGRLRIFDEINKKWEQTKKPLRISNIANYGEHDTYLYIAETYHETPFDGVDASFDIPELKYSEWNDLLYKKSTDWGKLPPLFKWWIIVEVS